MNFYSQVKIIFTNIEIEKVQAMCTTILLFRLLLSPWKKDCHVNCTDTKYRLFRRYKAGVFSFMYFNIYIIIVTVMLRGAKEDYFMDRFYDAIDN